MATVIPQLPFDDFLNYDELTRYLAALQESRPEMCRLGSIGQSRDGRDIPLLTIGDCATSDPDQRPAFLIQGNIHAGELAGSHAALFTAQRLLEDAAASQLLARVTFHIVPRLNPDGAERVVKTTERIRSRTDHSAAVPNRLAPEDVDGDGQILQMRIEHPDGEFARDPQDERLLVQRRADSEAPFYRVFPEGIIHDWDGGDDIQIGGRSLDWNRNWSYDWRPEPEQRGAGDFPFSEPEMRHIAEFVHARPNLFAALGYHTGPSAVLRPPSTGSVDDLDEEDSAIMEDLARIASDCTGFPVIPVVQYHWARSRDVNLRGHFHNFGYQHLGLFVFEFELGTMYSSAALSTEELLGARTEQDREAHNRLLLEWWDRERPAERVFQPWSGVEHPQLGAVEIGGLVSKYLYNPTLAHLNEISKGTYRFTVEHARRHPWVRIEDPRVDRFGEVLRIRTRVANRGALPTNVSARGTSLRRMPPVRVSFHPASAVELLSSTGHHELGHLPAVTGSRTLEWFVTAPDEQRELCEIRVDAGAGGRAMVTVPGPP